MSERIRHKNVALWQAAILRVKLVIFWNPDFLHAVQLLHLLLDKTDHVIRQLCVLALMLSMVVWLFQIKAPYDPVDLIVGYNDLVGCLWYVLYSFKLVNRFFIRLFGLFRIECLLAFEL